MLAQLPTAVKDAALLAAAERLVDRSDDVLATMRAHPHGTGARRIGTCVPEHPGMVVARTALGGTRVVTMPIGEQLPRIC